MTLHELTNEWLAIQAEINASDGEITEEIERRIADIEAALIPKVEGYCRLIKNYSIEAETVAEQAKPFRSEASRISDRAKSHKTAMERLRKRLLDELTVQCAEDLAANKKATIKTGLFTVTVKEEPPLITWEGEGNPPESYMTKPEPVVDLAKAAKLYDVMGHLPPGFKVTKQYGLTIR